MKILQTNTFTRLSKKLHRNQVPILKEAVAAIQQNPFIGEAKKGDLAGIRVYKFRMQRQLVLLAYLFDETVDQLTLIAFASHENFYTNLKKQLQD